MGTFIVVIVLVVFIVFALKNSIGHFQGTGGCCGSYEKVEKKRMLSVVDRRQVTISGIHCQNCEKKIKNKINQQSHLLCHRISHHKIAYIKSDQENDDEQIKRIIENLGYQVIDIYQ